MHIFYFARWCQSAFHSNCANLHFYQQCIRVHGVQYLCNIWCWLSSELVVVYQCDFSVHFPANYWGRAPFYVCLFGFLFCGVPVHIVLAIFLVCCLFLFFIYTFVGILYIFWIWTPCWLDSLQNVPTLRFASLSFGGTL